jgi:hypothetical protein
MLLQGDLIRQYYLMRKKLLKEDYVSSLLSDQKYKKELNLDMI